MRRHLITILVFLALFPSNSVAQSRHASDHVGFSIEFRENRHNARPIMTGKILGTGKTNKNLVGAEVISVGGQSIKSVRDYRLSALREWCFYKGNGFSEISIKDRNGITKNIKVQAHIERYPISVNLVGRSVSDSTLTSLVRTCLSGTFPSLKVRYDGDSIDVYIGDGGNPVRHVIARENNGLMFGSEVDFDRGSIPAYRLKSILDRISPEHPFEKIISYNKSGEIDRVFISTGWMRSDQTLRATLGKITASSLKFSKLIVRENARVLECHVSQDADRIRGRSVRPCPR